MILVSTAGKVGAEAARLLVGRSIPGLSSGLSSGPDPVTAPVRVLVRDPSSAKAVGLARAGVEVVAGDLTDPASLDAAMRGVRAVILVSPAVAAQEVNVIESAARAGVRHVVKITSKASSDSPIARRRGQAEIEAALVASGLGHTLLRNNAYMQNFLMPAPAIAATGGFGSSVGDGRIGMVDARDVAATAAQIAASPDGHDQKTYWPTGPETLSYPEAAKILSEVLGRPITYRRTTAAQDKQAMIDAGLPAAVAEDNVSALGLFDQGDADYVTDDIPTLLGRPARSFAQFAADYAEAFGRRRPSRSS
jgi:uncharacterized protein YbjT (DUF2867 family)